MKNIIKLSALSLIFVLKCATAEEAPASEENFLSTEVINTAYDACDKSCLRLLATKIERDPWTNKDLYFTSEYGKWASCMNRCEPKMRALIQELNANKDKPLNAANTTDQKPEITK